MGEARARKNKEGLIPQLELHKLARTTATRYDLQYFKVKVEKEKMSTNALKVLHMLSTFKDEDVLIAWSETVAFGLFIGRKELMKAGKNNLKLNDDVEGLYTFRYPDIGDETAFEVRYRNILKKIQQGFDSKRKANIIEIKRVIVRNFIGTHLEKNVPQSNKK